MTAFKVGGHYQQRAVCCADRQRSVKSMLVKGLTSIQTSIESMRLDVT